VVLEESGIEFDFSKALSVRIHDKTLDQGGEGNTLWNGVDFRVELVDQSLWIEVKSWDYRRIDPRRRGGQQRNFISKMRSKQFGNEIRSKFYGTSAFLVWTNNFQPKDTVFVILFQPPRPVDKALLGTLMQKRITPAFPRRNAPWTNELTCVVVDLADWNRLYPEFPARIL
jgi:hypothetical protein